MNILQSIKLYKKFNKAYKESKKLIESKKAKKDEVKKVVAALQTDLYSLSVFLPDFKEFYEEFKLLIKDVI